MSRIVQHSGLSNTKGARRELRQIIKKDIRKGELFALVIPRRISQISALDYDVFKEYVTELLNEFGSYFRYVVIAVTEQRSLSIPIVYFEVDDIVSLLESNKFFDGYKFVEDINNFSNLRQLKNN
jgi:hypothetical protein